MTVGLIITFFVILIGILLYVSWKTLNTPTPVVFNPLNTTYTVENSQVALVDGKSQTNATAIFGVPTMGDLNGDGKDDAAFIITQDRGGSGNFFYVVAAVNLSTGAVGTNAILLGDRIAPQNVEIKSGQIIVNYADRKIGEPMTAPPSVGVSMYLALDGTVLKKVNAPAQSVTFLVSPEDATKYCNGVDMKSDEYRQTITVPVITTTPANLTQTELVKFVVNAATTGMCQTALNQADISVANGVVQIPPLDGWAGISIALCSCQPQVEVNLLRLPGITNVSWSAK